MTSFSMKMPIEGAPPSDHAAFCSIHRDGRVVHIVVACTSEADAEGIFNTVQRDIEATGTATIVLGGRVMQGRFDQ